MARDKWVATEEAMPANIKTGNDLLEAIEGELVKLAQVTEWGPVIQGHVDISNKSLVGKVRQASALTRAAFHASQEANSMANQLLNAGIEDQTIKATNTYDSVEENPAASFNLR